MYILYYVVIKHCFNYILEIRAKAQELGGEKSNLNDLQ